MKYLKILLLPLIFAGSLTVLCDDHHDPIVKEFSNLIISAIINCHKKPFDAPHFSEHFEKIANEATLEQGSKAFKLKVNGVDPISRGRSIAAQMNDPYCGDLVEELNDMKMYFYLGSGNPETKNLTYSQAKEKMRQEAQE